MLSQLGGIHLKYEVEVFYGMISVDLRRTKC